MNRDRQRRLAAKKEFKKPVTKFEQINLETANYIPKGMTRAFKNTRYIVMIFDNSPTSHSPATKVMVQKHNDTPILKHWSEMQKIKNEIFGEETMAIEYYPPKNQLIDDYNIYWFWIFPEGIIPVPYVGK